MSRLKLPWSALCADLLDCNTRLANDMERAAREGWHMGAKVNERPHPNPQMYGFATACLLVLRHFTGVQAWAVAGPAA
eukprot:6182640-Pleurochrysis_carterae.AAC.2